MEGQLQEIELKFQVPQAARAAVLKAVQTATARQTRLQARYLDTAERHLALARAALRLRREGRRWVQTLKAEGDNPMQRLEHEVVLPVGRGAPVLDLRRHLDTPAAVALARALGLDPQVCAERIRGGDDLGLAVCFETDILRTHRELRVAGGRVELAFDQGRIRAAGRTLAVCELEMELCAGTPAALVALAQRWVQRHGLWLDVRSKAERGDLLARGAWASPPAHARPVLLSASMPPGEALRAMLRNGLVQVLANASVLADDAVTLRLPPGDREEHLHQWRVGLRRLRSALQVFGPALPAESEGPPGGFAPSPQWEPALSRCFDALGASRDIDAISASVLPALREAGAPWTALPPPTQADAASAGRLARDPEFTLLMLALLGGALAQAAPPAPKGALRAWLQACLAASAHAVHKGAQRFETLDDAARHRLRRRVKRLRYGLEFGQAVLPTRATAAQLAALRPVGEALGRYQDLCVARQMFDACRDAEPRAYWALGWLAARREAEVAQCARVLRKAAPLFKG